MRCESRNHLLWPLLTKVSSLPVLIRIQEDCSPEVAAALDVLQKEVKTRDMKNGKRSLRGVSSIAKQRLFSDFYCALVDSRSHLKCRVVVGLDSTAVLAFWGASCWRWSAVHRASVSSLPSIPCVFHSTPCCLARDSWFLFSCI